jgi:hypothetical protein
MIQSSFSNLRYLQGGLSIKCNWKIEKLDCIANARQIFQNKQLTKQTTSNKANKQNSESKIIPKIKFNPNGNQTKFQTKTNDNI